MYLNESEKIKTKEQALDWVEMMGATLDFHPHGNETFCILTVSGYEPVIGKSAIAAVNHMLNIFKCETDGVRIE